MHVRSDRLHRLHDTPNSPAQRSVCCLTHTHTYSLAPTLTLWFEKECECASHSFLFTESAAHRKICLMECSLTRPTPGAFCLGRCSACFLCERESVCSGARSVRRGNGREWCLPTHFHFKQPGSAPGGKKNLASSIMEMKKNFPNPYIKKSTKHYQ